MVVDASGREHPPGRAATPWERVPTGAELDPEALVAAAAAAAREAIANAPAGRVAGVGVASMAEAGVLLGDGDRPVAPIIAWYDSRGSDEATRLAIDLPDFTRRTGLPPTSTATIAKHTWLRDHGLTGARWLNVAEWVVHRLGGDQMAELSLACRTGYLDLGGRWWPPALDWAGVRPGFLPDPLPAGRPAGRCRLSEARGALLTVAGHDHPCACIGAGATRSGDVLDSCGTAEALVRGIHTIEPEQVERAVARGVTVGWHVIAARKTLLAGFQSGKLLAGLDLDTGAGGEVVEALAAKARKLLSVIDEIAGPHRRLVVSGGWARHPAVRAAKERQLGRFQEARTQEAGARGAALLAASAAGVEVRSGAA